MRQTAAGESHHQQGVIFAPGFLVVDQRGTPSHDFYDRVVDLTGYSFSTRAISRRLFATQGWNSRWMNLLRAVSTEGFGRVGHHTEIRKRLDTDPHFLPYFEQQTGELPEFYIDIVRNELGLLWKWLPTGALHHDPYAYLKSEQSTGVYSIV